MRAFLILILLLLGAPPAPAQVVGYREWSRQRDETGISRGSYTFGGTFRASQANFVEVQLAHPRLAVQFVTPRAGMSRSDQLASMAARVDGKAAMAYDPFPGFNDPFALEGLRFVDGRLLSWPPVGPHLLFRPEGAVELHSPPALPATVIFDDGTSIPLISVNGRLPASGGEGAALHTGEIAAGSLPVVAWPGEILALVLRTPRPGGDIHREILSPEAPLIIDRVVNRAMLRTNSTEAALLLHPPLPPALAGRLRAGGAIRFSLSLDRETLAAAAVVPAGRWIVREGELAEDFPATHFLRNAVAVDARLRRLMLIAPMDDGRGGAGIPPAQFARFLEEEGFQHGFELPGRAPALLDQIGGRASLAQAAATQTRLALVIAGAGPALRLPEVDGDLFRITGVAAEGTRTEFLLNQPNRLADERTAFTPGLDQFWAARLPASASFSTGGRQPGPRSVRFLMPRPIPVRAMELVHIEAAGFSPSFNLKHYRLWGRARAEAPWLLLKEVRHDAPAGRERLVLPPAPPLAEIRLEVLEPNFLPGGDVARLAEAYFWGPEPAFSE